MTRASTRVARGAFEQHMLDAIALNESRAPLYASLSAGASLPISRRLIAMERALLPLARWFDKRSQRWERAGISMFAEIFVPMNGAPAFAEHGDVVRNGGEQVHVAPVRRAVWQRYRAERFEGAGVALRDALDALTGEPGANCMVRHLLESARRLTVLAPCYIRRSGEQGLPSPRRLLALLLRLHLWGLASAARLDDRARPLQARGIPILARDLPPIPDR